MSQATETQLPMHEHVADLAWRLGREFDRLRQEIDASGGDTTTVSSRVFEQESTVASAIEAGSLFSVPVYQTGKNFIQVWLDGIYVSGGEGKLWQENAGDADTSTTILFNGAIEPGSVLTVRVTEYSDPAAVSITEQETVLTSALAAGGTLTVPQYIVGKGQVQVWIDGAYASGGTGRYWEERGTANTYSTAIVFNDGVDSKSAIIVRVTIRS